MTVTCALFGPLREAAGRKNVELDIDSPASVRAVLDALIEAEPALADDLAEVEGSGSLAITVDGTHIEQQDGFDTTVEDGAVVRLTPPIVGGSEPVDA